MSNKKPKTDGRGGWRGGGRPAKSDAEKNVAITVSLTPELREQVKRNNESPSVLIRRLLTEYFNK